MKSRYPDECGVMTLFQAYFDESGTHDGSPVMAVAAYVYESQKCAQLDLEWKVALNEFGLPYFHMTDCALGYGEFAFMDKAKRIAAQTAFMEIIKKYASCGVYALAHEETWSTVMSAFDPFGSAYTWCCFVCLAGINNWINEQEGGGDVAYFFESGHRFQGQASNLMASLFKNQTLRAEFRYSSHSFVDKAEIRPIQSADVLAWQAAKDFKNAKEGSRPRRLDFRSILSVPTQTMYGSPDMLAEFQEFMKSYRLFLSLLWQDR